MNQRRPSAAQTNSRSHREGSRYLWIPFQLWLPPQIETRTYHRLLRQPLVVFTCTRSTWSPPVRDHVAIRTVPKRNAHKGPGGVLASTVMDFARYAGLIERAPTSARPEVSRAPARRAPARDPYGTPSFRLQRNVAVSKANECAWICGPVT